MTSSQTVCASKIRTRQEWALYSLQALSTTKLAHVVNNVLQGNAFLYSTSRSNSDK